MSDPAGDSAVDRSRLRLLLTGIGLVGVAVGVGGVALLETSETADGGIAFTVIALFITWSFIGTGLFAWWHRPESRVGALMVGVGFAFVLNALTSSDESGVFIAGVLLGNVWIVLLFQLLLTFPSGRLRDRNTSGCSPPAPGSRASCCRCRRCCSCTRPTPIAATAVRRTRS